MSTAPSAPEKTTVPPSSAPGTAGGDRNPSAVGNGVGRSVAVSSGAAKGSGNSNGGRPPAQSNSAHHQPKKRRVIDDDDDDDDLPAAPKPLPSPVPAVRPTGGSSSGGGGVVGGKTSGMNGSSSSHSGDRQSSEKRKIVAGPPSSGKGAGSSARESSSKPASTSRKGNDDDDDDVPLGAMLKKQPKAPGASSRNNAVPSKIPSKNGVKSSGSKSFTIPKREGMSPSQRNSSQGAVSSGGKSVAGSYSSSSRPGGMGNKRPGSNSSSTRRDNDDDDDFEQKPVKLKKRPEDFTRDPHSKSAHKRKLEEQRIKEEAARKKKQRNSQGSSSTKVKVKAEPGRRGSSSAPRSRSTGKAKSQRAKVKTEVQGWKETTRAERIELAMKVYKWWEEPAHEHGKQWESLEHNGAHFAPEYKPHNVKLKYDGKDVYLTPQQEEVATFYASMPLDGPQLSEQGTVFNKNFFTDFKKVLGKGHKIKDFKLLDFSAMRAHLDIAKQIKRAATDGEKAAAKTVKEELTHKYSYAIVDNHLEKVGNYNVEPPGLFRGRGKHPKTGMLKARVVASDIAINCAEGVCVPRCNMPGYAWQYVQHDPSVTWLSKWDGLLAGTKYMMLAASSSFKGKSDMAKYDKAMKLKGFIERIRADYTKKLSSGDKRTKQIATAVWIIDKLALRVGGEKGDDEADTVGCCSLRTEHLTFHEDNSVHEIDLEFLGKDSMLFKETIDFDRYGDIGKRVFKNLQAFCKGKRQSEEVFDYLDPSILNQHLQSLMPGLTAKVFRTYNASDTLQRQLPGEDVLSGLSLAEKVAQYNGANREVAILCNHQRTVSSAQKEGLEKLHDELEMFNKQKLELKQMLRTIKSGKGSVRLKPSDKSVEEGAVRAVEKAKQAKANAKTDAEKVAATKAAESAAALRKAAQKSKQETMHLFAKNPGEDSVAGRIKNWTDKIKKLQIKIRDRDDNKEVSLSTSKINYMDPRVSVAWCKRHEVPVEKVFAKTLRDKFVWAMNVPPDWDFSYETLYNSKQSVLDVPPPPGGTKKKTTTAAAAAAAPKASPKAAAAVAEATAKKVQTKPPTKPSPTEAKGKGKATMKVEEESSSGEESGSGSSGSGSGSSSGSGSEESSSGEEESGSSSGEEESGSSSGEEESGSSSGEEESGSSSGEEESGSDEDDGDSGEASSTSKKRRSSGAGGGGSSKKARRPIIDGDDEEEDEDEDNDDSDFDGA
ncbi:unnamed protein product [Pylaiella littoralis]